MQTLRYKGYMTQEIIEFCGKHNIVSESHQNSGALAYFLTTNNISKYHMFSSNMYIIKTSDGNISLDYIKPIL